MMNDVSCDAYARLLGKPYGELLESALFQSLITGNEPEIVDEGLDDFYIISETNQAECIFNKHSQVLEAILFREKADGTFPSSLTSKMNADEVRSILGVPTESVPRRKLPVLGVVPPFDKFDGNIEVTYSIESGLVEEVRFSL